MRLLLTTLLLATSSAVHADPLGELRQLLASLPGSQPVAAQIELEFTNIDEDEDGDTDTTPQNAKINLRAEDGADGIRLHWPRDLMDAAAAERGDRDPDAKRPVRRALSQVAVQDIDDYLDAAPSLLNVIAQASLQSDAPDTRNGQSLRRLTLKLDPPLSKQARKYVKEIDATASIWLDAAGLPVAAEQTLEFSGRAMLVISFANETHESWEFVRSGDRLVVVRHDSESSSSGGGESGRQRTKARVIVD
jgi:hypothetical protein